MQLATLKTRKLEGRLGVTLQTDPGQVQGKRQNPAHKAVYIPVYQEFNPAAFNFAKAKPVETLFRLDFPPKPRGDHDGEAKSDAGPPPHAVLANISPLIARMEPTNMRKEASVEPAESALTNFT